MGQGSPKQGINEEIGWYSRNISSQAHKVIRSKKKDKAVSDMMKQYDRINGLKAYDHKEESMGSAGYKDEGFRLSNTQPKKGWKEENMSPKANTSFTPQRININ